MMDPLAHLFTKAAIGIGVSVGVISCGIVGLKVVETYFKNIGDL
jgi:hypothetical protein